MTEETPMPAVLSATFDERGLSLQSLEVSFFADARVDAWLSLITTCGLVADDGTTESGERARVPSVTFAALPTELGVGAWYLTGTAHEHTKKKKSAATVATDGARVHWEFEWHRAPGSEAPTDLRTKSAAVGGYPTILKKLAEAWPGVPELKSDVTARFLIDGHRSKLLFDHTEGFGMNIELGQGRRVTRQPVITTWLAEPPSGPVERLVISMYRERLLSVSTFGTHAVRIGDDMLAGVEHALTTGLAVFLDRVSEGGTQP